MSEPTRYQLRLKGAAQELLDQMSKELGSTPKDVILDALAVMHYAVGAINEGRQFGSYDPRKEQFTAIVTPTLQSLSDRLSRRMGRSNHAAG